MQGRTLLLLSIFSAAAAAQSSSGYVYFAPGGLTASGMTAMTIQAAAGGDFIIAKGIGVGAEIGAIAPRDDLSSVVGVFSPDASYHFIHTKESKIDPYVTGGYTMFFRSGTESLFNFGFGANYWFAARVGVKVEFRDQVYTSGGTAHFWGVHMGVAFR